MSSFDDWYAKATEEERAFELIERRRRQLIIHACIYYNLNNNLVSDKQWDAWAYELVQLQSTYPELAKRGCFAKDFEGFDGSTGFDLPINGEWAMRKADQLIRINRELDT